MSKSIAERIAALDPADRRAMFEGMSEDEVRAILFDWALWGRPEQMEPAVAWAIWYIETGRGFGKTRTTSELFHKKMNAGHARYAALVHRTAGDIREVMIEGESGLLATAKPGLMPVYEPSKRRLTWPTGGQATTYSAVEPDRLRGPTHDLGWGEEFATWKTVVGVDGATAFDNLRFSMRGTHNPAGPQLVLTTTPKRVKSVKQIHIDAALPNNPYNIVITKGSLRDNIANLPPDYVRGILEKYAGTALGDQEIEGILTNDVEGSLWKSKVLNDGRIEHEGLLPSLDTPAVAVDPSVGDGSGDECGISVVALSAGTMRTEIQQGGLSVIRDMKHGYVLDDLTIAGPPDVWAAKVVETAQHWKTTTVVAEGNQGGEMIRPLIRALDASMRVKIVHARVGKEARAQPVAGLFAQGRWHIVGELPLLEDELTTHVFGKGQKSPNRLDAMVWGATHLEPQIQRGKAGNISVTASGMSKQIR